MKTVAYTMVFLALCNTIFGQRLKKSLTEPEQPEFAYKHEFSFGARLHSNGWTIFGEKVKFKSIYLSRVLQVEFSGYRNLKESKQSVPPDNTGKDYFFGKHYIY